MDEMWTQFRRAMIYHRVPDESYIRVVEDRLVGRDNNQLAYRMYLEGDRITAERLLAAELAKMGYERVRR